MILYWIEGIVPLIIQEELYVMFKWIGRMGISWKIHALTSFLELKFQKTKSLLKSLRSFTGSFIQFL